MKASLLLVVDKIYQMLRFEKMKEIILISNKTFGCHVSFQMTQKSTEKISRKSSLFFRRQGSFRDILRIQLQEPLED
jgi:hypothetical protein